MKVRPAWRQTGITYFIKTKYEICLRTGNFHLSAIQAGKKSYFGPVCLRGQAGEIFIF